jgi:hypothetical protein
VKLRLKDDPREWRKFGISSALVLALITGWLCWRAVLAKPVAVGILAGLWGIALLAIVRPRSLRGPYRLGMRVSHGMGRVIAPVVLSLVFLLVLTPLGLLLRLMGKELLRLHRDPLAGSYWQEPSGSADLTKMF